MASKVRYSAIGAGEARKRVDALKAMAVLDTPPEDGYDALTRLAATVCATPIAIISLIDGERIWFKSAHGVTAGQIASAYSFCCEAANSRQPLQVPDARIDPRFADNPLVCGEPGVRFYAGAPIVHNDVAIGTVCVLDRTPRELAPAARTALGEIANVAACMLRARIEAVQFVSETRM